MHNHAPSDFLMISYTKKLGAVYKVLEEHESAQLAPSTKTLRRKSENIKLQEYKTKPTMLLREQEFPSTVLMKINYYSELCVKP